MMEPTHRAFQAMGPQTDWRNIHVISVFTFVDSLQFSFFVWSFWPFVQQLDSTIGASFVGFIMAVSGIGEAISAPIFGYWTNRCGRVLPPVYTSILVSATGNLIYLTLNGWPLATRTCGLLISRFLSGAGTGNRGCFRALVAAASAGIDRAKALASSGGAALIGLTIGPATQMAFNWIGPEGIDLGFMRVSMYTAPALLALAINAATAVFLHFFLLDELDAYVPKKSAVDEQSQSSEASGTSSDSKLSSTRSIPMDVLAVVICMGTRAIRMLVTANIESIGAPFSEVMFGWEKEEALKWNSVSQAVVGGASVGVFLLYLLTNYTHWVSERENCLGALLGMLTFYILTMPWPFLPETPPACENFTGNGTHHWDWCWNLSAVSPYLFYISYAIFFGLALPVLNNSLQALYSKVLGSGRQGTMQGVSQSVGSAARILGPLFMSSTFQELGPQFTWGVVIGLLVLCILVWLVAYRRLIPVEERTYKIFDSSQSTVTMENRETRS